MPNASPTPPEPWAIPGAMMLFVFYFKNSKKRLEKKVQMPQGQLSSKIPSKGLNGFNTWDNPKSNDATINPRPNSTPRNLNGLPNSSLILG